MAACFALLAYLGIGLGGPETIVLCIEGGRIAVEVGICGAPEPVEGRCDNPCVDIPLITAGIDDPLVLADKLPLPSPPSLVSIPSHAVAVVAPRVTGSLVTPSAAEAAPALRSIRTVVLLI